MLSKKQVLIFIVALFFSCVSVSYAENKVAGVTVLTQSAAKAEILRAYVKDLFNWINTTSKHPQSLSDKQMHKYFRANVHYTVNGKHLANNRGELTKRFNKLLMQYHSISVIRPLNTIIVANEMFAVTYQLKKKDKEGHSFLDKVTAIVKLKEGKISDWQAVVGGILSKEYL